jgi:hypothetical protein
MRAAIFLASVAMRQGHVGNFKAAQQSGAMALGQLRSGFQTSAYARDKINRLFCNAITKL